MTERDPSQDLVEARSEGIRGQYSVQISRRDWALRAEVAAFDMPELGARAPAACFLAAYGPTRRVAEDSEAEAWWSASDRIRRIASLLETDAPLTPLDEWLPEVPRSGERFAEIRSLVNDLLPPDARFKARRERGAYLFEQGGASVPRSSLSDGLQSYLAWTNDLVWRLHQSAGHAPLDSVPGVVLVDEVDQRIHPRWQQSLLSRLSTALPRLQFICTAHSALLTGSLRPRNLVLMEPDPEASGEGGTRAGRLSEDVFGGTADQVLTSSYFDLESSRALAFRVGLRSLALAARRGEEEAAVEFIRRLASAGRRDGPGGDSDATGRQRLDKPPRSGGRRRGERGR